MRYEVAKYIYKITNYEQNIVLWNSEETEKHAYKIAEEFGDVKLFFKIKKDLEMVHSKCIYPDGAFMPKHHLVGAKRFQKKDVKTWSKSSLLYLFFVLIETKLYVGEHVSFYKSLLACVQEEYNAYTFAYMKDIILSYVLQTQQGFSVYIALIKSWKEVEQKLQESDETGEVLSLPSVDNVNSLSFLQWKEILEKGLEDVESEKKTRLSMATLGSEFIAALKNKNNVGKENIEEIFSTNMLKRAINTEERRKWYFFRILFFIIEKQIRDIERALEDYRAGVEGSITRLQECVSDCWLEKEEKKSIHFKKSWSQIAENPNLVSEFSIKQIKEELYHSRVIPAQIARSFNYCFEGVTLEDEVALEEEMDRQRLKGKKVKRTKKGYAFEGYKLRCHLHVRKELEEEEAEKALKTRAAAYRIQDLLMDKKCKISREMLLLTILLAKTMGVDIDMDYALNHVLNNSRFLNKLSNNAFDNYFKDTMLDFKYVKDPDVRIDILQMNSRDLEELYLGFEDEDGVWQDGIAIFHEILYAKEVN